MNKQFKGKAIYNPSGKAGEYSYWACNFYNGCSCMCTYCFNKKGRGAKILGGDTPMLKKCFKDENDAHDIFRWEVLKNVNELRKHGLFFSFTTDPMLPETIGMTFKAMNTLVTNGIPIKILTKRADWVNEFLSKNGLFVCDGKTIKAHKIAIGLTLTGHDELEPGASTNQERIEAMKKLHEVGFKTFASIEPIIDVNSSQDMVRATLNYCDLYKIGLQSGKCYNSDSLKLFIDTVIKFSLLNGYKGHKNGIAIYGNKPKIYFKDSLLKQAGIERKDLPSICVGRDYNLFGKEATK